MKKDIHPEYNVTTVKCVCGNEFETRSTLKEISVEICSACHPFFTGQQKLIDSAGRVERFMKKYGREYGTGAAGGSSAAAPAKVEAPAKGSDEPAPEAKAKEVDSKPDVKAQPPEEQDKTSE